MQIKINGQTISLAAPEPFLSILRREKIYFPLYCGGRGTCGKCRIRITEGSLPITTEDRQFFSEDELKAGYRLGCRAVITASCAITFEEIQREDGFYVPPVQHAESFVREPIQQHSKKVRHMISLAVVTALVLRTLLQVPSSLSMRT